MKLHKRKFSILPATVLFSLALCGGSAAGAVAVVPGGPGEPEIALGTQVAQVEGFDWGPGVSKTILSLDHVILSESVSPEKFSVIENKETYNFAEYAKIKDKGPATHMGAESERVLVAAYTCDENGNPISGSSSYVALEMRCTPSVGSSFCYDVLVGKNFWCDYYTLDVSLKDGSVLAAADGVAISELRVEASVDWDKVRIPDLDGIDVTGSFTGSDGDSLTYASYVPANASAANKRPLVIWLHGAGEGGTDPRLALLGNKVTALTKSEFQNEMQGAYILAPQVPDFWLTYDKEGNWKNNPGVDSVHLQSLKELIDSYVAENPGVDSGRILIGGCSNGGYMTMDMVLNYPDYFAAAFPICEAYLDTGITDAQLQGIKDLPIWFVYAKNDTVVNPELYEIPTIKRLKAISDKVHTSVFDDVHDTTGLYLKEDGSAHQYSGHWSWLYFFNNLCKDKRVNMWNWMSKQKK